MIDNDKYYYQQAFGWLALALVVVLVLDKTGMAMDCSTKLSCLVI